VRLNTSFPVALQSLKDLGRLTYRFLELFRHLVGLLGRVISRSQGLYLHRTTQHRRTRTNIHALSGIRTHDPSNQPVKTHASDSTATVTGIKFFCLYNNKGLDLIQSCIGRYTALINIAKGGEIKLPKRVKFATFPVIDVKCGILKFGQN
jgi:hypothetical protein